MHLGADRVADAMREEGIADPGGQRRLGTDVDDVEVLEDPGQCQVGVQVQLAVVEAGGDLCTQLLLGRIDRSDQRLELRMPVGGVGAGDVGRIAPGRGTGVDQEAARVGRALLVQLGVVQHRAVFVERDDVAVGQLVGILLRGRAVGHVDLELAGPGAEGRFGGAMGPHRRHLRMAHQCNFIRRLERAVPVQVVDDRGGVVRRKTAQGAVGLAQDRAAGRIGRQQGQGLLRLADDVDIEMLDPPAAGSGRHHVPVIARLVEDQLRALARGVDDPAVRDPRQRQPMLEMRVDRERIIAVIKYLVVQAAGGNDQMVPSGTRQRGIGARGQGAEVVGIQRGGIWQVHGLTSRDDSL